MRAVISFVAYFAVDACPFVKCKLVTKSQSILLIAFHILYRLAYTFVWTCRIFGAIMHDCMCRVQCRLM